MTRKLYEQLADSTVDFALAELLIQGARLTEPVFGACVLYELEDGDLLPLPRLAVGLDSERRALRTDARRHDLATEPDDEEEEGDIVASVYDPTTYANVARAPAVFAEQLDAARRAFGPQPRELWVDFYIDVAQRLAARGARDVVPATDDFCVFSTDEGLGALAASFRATVPLFVRRQLAADGWIPRSLARRHAGPYSARQGHFHLTSTGGSSAYVHLLPRATRKKSARNVSLSSLVEPYVGPELIFDLDEDHRLTGVEILGE